MTCPVRACPTRFFLRELDGESATSMLRSGCRAKVSVRPTRCYSFLVVADRFFLFQSVLMVSVHFVSLCLCDVSGCPTPSLVQRNCCGLHAEHGASFSQMSAGKFLDTISRVLGVAGEANDSFSAHTRVRMSEGIKIA